MTDDLWHRTYDVLVDELDRVVALIEDDKASSEYDVVARACELVDALASLRRLGDA